MRYEITLEIGQEYSAPSSHMRHLVHILPSDLPGRQRVTSRLLTVSPPASERRESRDFFGNATVALAFHKPVQNLTFTLRARAERLAPAQVMDLTPGWEALGAEIAACRSLAASAPHHFRPPSPRIAPDPAITAYAMGVAHPGMSVLDVVTALGEALHRDMKFEAGATDSATPAAQAFAARHGVCQDFSHIMIAGLRALGVPAGYVSGFLRTLPPPGQPRLEGADAMHAWVRIWCGSETGWVEYDPTNACFAGTDHVVVAYGRDYGDVAPVRGILRSSGAQNSYHSVDVKPLTPEA